tara:strand:- start:52 stop:921 length:870 start_codon:yes stop_codon:yes gene_type:complete
VNVCKRQFLRLETKHIPIVLNWFWQDDVQASYSKDDFQKLHEDMELYCQASNTHHSNQRDYRLVCRDNHPIALMMTSSSERLTDDLIKKWCVPEGVTYLLDILIGDRKFFNDEQLIDVINAFVFKQLADKDYLLVSLKKSNIKSLQVFEENGFNVLGEYVPSYRSHEHMMLRLKIGAFQLERLIFKKEDSLLNRQTRGSAHHLSNTLADDFMEFGSSGKIHLKDDVINWLSQEISFDYEIMDFKVQILSENTVLSTYRIRLNNRFSLRSSVWVLKDLGWQLKFHQGTTI